MEDDQKVMLLKRIKELEAEVKERESDLARFRQELAGANEKLEGLIAQLSQELKLALRIQKALVPTEFPHIPGFEFSTKFVPSHISGGDYFDIFEHEDRFRFGVILSSATGYSMSALFLSVLLKFTGQMEARRGAEPQKVLTRMAKELVPMIEGADSADVFYGRIDRRSYELSYSRVGRAVALHQSYLTGEVRSLSEGVESFHSEFNSPIKSQTVALNPRDRLILCTRGVIEAKNLKEEEFGVERLVKSIHEAPKKGVHELRNEILYSVQSFTSGKEPARDQTVLVLEVKDRVIKLAKH